jgi:mRNA degradation ribonuclease J1/J2
LVERQLKEKALHQADLRVLGSETIHLGPFKADTVRCGALISTWLAQIDTPVGTVVHTGDYKWTRRRRGPNDRSDTLRRLTPNGCFAMLGDSTNATA